MEHGQEFRIFVLSDGTGQAGKRMLEAALLQFDLPVMVIRIPQVGSVEEVREVVAEAACRGGMIVYTLVGADLRQALQMAARAQGVITVDLLGGLLGKLQLFLQGLPWDRPGLLGQGDTSYRAWMNAMEFTIQHDDGRGLDDLAEADLVLVGASRTSKTPVSFYLACGGWKVANVPIVLGVAPPDPLRALEARCVVGLTMEAERLAVLRRAHPTHRDTKMDASHADLERIREEVRYSRSLCRAHHWPVVDVTGKAIEETASEIVRLTTSDQADVHTTSAPEPASSDARRGQMQQPGKTTDAEDAMRHG